MKNHREKHCAEVGCSAGNNGHYIPAVNGKVKWIWALRSSSTGPAPYWRLQRKLSRLYSMWLWRNVGRREDMKGICGKLTKKVIEWGEKVRGGWYTQHWVNWLDNWMTESHQNWPRKVKNGEMSVRIAAQRGQKNRMVFHSETRHQMVFLAFPVSDPPWFPADSYFFVFFLSLTTKSLLSDLFLHLCHWTITEQLIF